MRTWLCVAMVVGLALPILFVSSVTAQEPPVSAQAGDTLGWVRMNTDGFGDAHNTYPPFASVYNGYLYVMTGNSVTGGQIWRSSNGVDWNQVNSSGFGDVHNDRGYFLVDFNGRRYIGTYNETTGGQVWSCQNCDVPGDWHLVNGNGLGDSHNADVEPELVLNGYLYADTTNNSTGAEVWRYDGNTWRQVNSNGFGDINNTAVTEMIVFSDTLYLGTVNYNSGGEMWRCRAATGCRTQANWQQVGGDGLGDAHDAVVWPLAVLDNCLYVGTLNFQDGARVYRTADGDTWHKANLDGFGDSQNQSVRQGAVFQGALCTTTTNWNTGLQIWRTANGTTWELVSAGGLGDSNNRGAFLAAFQGELFAMTRNDVTGTEVWMAVTNRTALPAVLKQQ